jgi:hypothetical protein
MLYSNTISMQLFPNLVDITRVPTKKRREHSQYSEDEDAAIDIRRKILVSNQLIYLAKRLLHWLC